MHARIRWATLSLLLAALLAAACIPVTPQATSAPTSAAPAATSTAPAVVENTPAASVMQWSEPPAMTIDPERIYHATLKTDKGDIVVELLASKAPITVNNFVFLARQGYYDNTTFHRVLPNFMAQGGDPSATGAGGPGYTFRDEFHPDLLFNQPGLLAMANAGPATNGSQFFITTVPTPHLNGRHTIFGQVVSGLDVVEALRERDPDINPDYEGDRLITVEIEELDESSLPAPTPLPEATVPVPEDGRPLADLPVEERENIFERQPEMVIDPTATYVAVIETSKGDIRLELNAAAAPQSVNNFVVLANLGYWDNFPIVFVQPNQFVLTGSPGGRETSDVGYVLPLELGQSNTAGAVGYWFRADRAGSSGSQFYLLLADNTFLDNQFTVFGTVTEGLDVAAQLAQGDLIERVVVEE